MCCFSRDVQDVARTRIFVRLDGPRQWIVYAMRISADEDLAMVLPIPVAAGSGERALTFVDLEAYPTFFEDVQRGFPQPDRSRGHNWGPAEGGARKLEVQKVGAYDASYVPEVEDFSRLDERFRIPPETWREVPDVKGFGFAVFKLRPGREQDVHPMAFSFPTARPNALVFPTLHIHDGVAHERAAFDHVLYAQLPEGRSAAGDFSSRWTESPEPASRFVDPEKSRGIVDGEAHAYRRPLTGDLPNTDTVVALA